jgi:hypothetical protein
MTLVACSVTRRSSPFEPDAMFTSTTARKRLSSAAVTVGSLDTGAVCSDKSNDSVSWVRPGRDGLCGPAVEKIRESVWRKSVRICGTKKGLWEGAEDLEPEC